MRARLVMAINTTLTKHSNKVIVSQLQIKIKLETDFRNLL
jgi:hypothetical protein